MSQKFLIKHSSGGKFFHVKGGDKNPGNNTPIVLHQDIHDNMHWTFEVVEDYWGYIKHVSSGKILHPSGGSLSPGNSTQLVVHNDRHYGALFALDAVKDHVVHKGGRFAHPKGGSTNPGNDTRVVLHSDVHDAMRFQFVSTSNPNKEVLGKWKIINMVRNPLAEHVAKLHVKIGKSRTESTTTSFQYTWETSAGINIDMLSASVSQSMQFMLEKSSSASWSEEVTRVREIKVSPGSTVVTWQYVFDIQQNESMSVFQSNLLADTDSETKEPKDMQYAM